MELFEKVAEIVGKCTTVNRVVDVFKMSAVCLHAKKATLDLDVNLTYLISKSQQRTPEKEAGKETISVVNCVKNVMVNVPLVSQKLRMKTINQSKTSAHFCAQ